MIKNYSHNPQKPLLYPVQNKRIVPFFGMQFLLWFCFLMGVQAQTNTSELFVTKETIVEGLEQFYFYKTTSTEPVIFAEKNTILSGWDTVKTPLTFYDAPIKTPLKATPLHLQRNRNTITQNTTQASCPNTKQINALPFGNNPFGFKSTFFVQKAISTNAAKKLNGTQKTNTHQPLYSIKRPSLKNIPHASPAITFGLKNNTPLGLRLFAKRHCSLLLYEHKRLQAILFFF